jgi:hypothetical protein
MYAMFILIVKFSEQNMLYFGLGKNNKSKIHHRLANLTLLLAVATVYCDTHCILRYAIYSH